MPATSNHVRLPDRYSDVRRIAAGGMATVHVAHDTLLDRPVAVKVLGERLASDDAARQRFQREARAAARLSDHPHVVTIFDIGEQDGTPFIVMEHFAGGTVADRLRSGAPITRAQAVAWLDGAASALDHAHRHGIVHRDVKPGNLLLDAHGRVAVADFGIARMASESHLTQTGQVMGTAAYLSPEQAVGEPARPASDRYALAVVAFELLTGRRPFVAETLPAQAQAHVDDAPPAASELAPDLPPTVDRVLWRGLEKDPRRRWPTACAMVHALDEALDGDEARRHATAPTRAVDPVAAVPRTPIPPRTPPPRTPHPRTPPPRAPSGGRPAAGRPRRRPAWGLWVALGFVALIAGAGIAAMTAGGGDSPTASVGRHAGGAAHHARHHRSTAARSAGTAAQTTARAAATTATTTTPQAASSDPAALEAQGHQLIAQGAYDQAIPVLQQAVQDCPVSQTDPCAYAYYDLGHALRLAGRPDEAIPVLQTRLQNPDQRGTVQAELAAAQEQAGGGGAAKPGKGPKGPKPGKGPTG